MIEAGQNEVFIILSIILQFPIMTEISKPVLNIPPTITVVKVTAQTGGLLEKVSAK